MASKASAFCLVIVLFVCFNCKCNQASHSNLSREEELELEAQLKLLNKPPIKTFKTKEGDTIDCVNINKQPALDHPSLKNHKVQTRPSIYLYDLFKNSSKSNYDSLVSNNSRECCPVGFVPIRRTLKRDLIRLRSLSLNKQESRSQSSNMPDYFDYDDNFGDKVKFPYNQNVVSFSSKKEGKYYGASARFAVYNLSVTTDQSSSSNMWIVGGPSDALSVIIAGWQVNPSVNGDSLTRLFVYWTADGGVKTGCYNMLCQGFVQVHPNITPDFPLSPTSTYRGPQYDYQFTIIQQSGNWWLLVGEHQEALGYWPNELFPYLSNGADQVAWGGIAKPSPDGKSPPLGNGRKPKTGMYYEGCFIRSTLYIVDGYKVKSPPRWDHTPKYVSNRDCYDLNASETCGNDELQNCFTYGGPGGDDCQATII